MAPDFISKLLITNLLCYLKIVYIAKSLSDGVFIHSSRSMERKISAMN